MPASASSPVRQFVAAAEDAGVRLDRFLAARLPELSRTRVQELIEAGLVRVNGGAGKGAQRLRGGERIEIEPQPRPPLRAAAENIPLEIIYEDEELLVVNKPAGMTVHAGAGQSSGTLVNALLGRGQALSSGGDALRPGIVHRLDKGTSGVLLVAKNDEMHARLSALFASRAISKTYIALVEGAVTGEHGRIELPIGRDPRNRVRMTARKHPAGRVRAARTDWRVLARVGGCTLLEVQLHTGRTHQIRVHFSALRHPIVGDTLYGAERREKAGKTELPELGRYFLHAARLVFAHPRTGATVDARAPLPAALREYLRELAAGAGEDAEKMAARLDREFAAVR
ncbi:MAG: RluA family pseudouridine synthase [Acidobacteriia bacterium]|nr:RluA family pseudouridine synthase [Terriglobia bacterium]